ncbi:hypothetical protein [Adlercreutzia sp. ZJ305]|uniref:hypothetical protein n=1 Tax=Adlercreutzia sp. ZJ305 TaxID=2709408 RepID=UPI0013EDC5F4|nr:hypothetical protein [Adlercreutzia sp. ZJ305]
MDEKKPLSVSRYPRQARRILFSGLSSGLRPARRFVQDQIAFEGLPHGLLEGNLQTKELANCGVWEVKRLNTLSPSLPFEGATGAPFKAPIFSSMIPERF